MKGTEKIIAAEQWTSAAGWKKMETDGRYETIPKEDKAYPGLERLRAIVKGYQYWLNRYRTDLPQTANAKKYWRVVGLWRHRLGRRGRVVWFIMKQKNLLMVWTV